MGLIRRDGGSVTVFGVEPGSSKWDSVKGMIGYLPEDSSPYDRLTGWENIMFNAMLYSHGDRDKALEMASRAIEISGLSMSDLEKRAGSYSRGMKRRLLIGISLMHDPRLVVMDEPTSGLDVFSAYRIKRMIKQLSMKGYTFLITTHDMREAEELATHIGFIARGRIIYEGRVDDALRRYNSESLEEAFIKAVGDEGG